MRVAKHGRHAELVLFSRCRVPEPQNLFRVVVPDDVEARGLGERHWANDLRTPIDADVGRSRSQAIRETTAVRVPSST